MLERKKFLKICAVWAAGAAVVICALWAAAAAIRNFNDNDGFDISAALNAARHGITVSSVAELSDKVRTDTVYKMRSLTYDLAVKEARDILDSWGDSADMTTLDRLGDTVYLKGGVYSVELELAGGGVTMTRLVGTDPAMSEGCSDEYLRGELTKYGVSVPKRAVFSDDGNGYYTYDAFMVKDDDDAGLCDGMLTCRVSKRYGLVYFSNSITEYERYEDCSVISPREVLERIEGGDVYPQLSENAVVRVSDVELMHRVNADGYYEPFYSVDCTVDGAWCDLQVPAIG